MENQGKCGIVGQALTVKVVVAKRSGKAIDVGLSLTEAQPQMKPYNKLFQPKLVSVNATDTHPRIMFVPHHSSRLHTSICVLLVALFATLSLGRLFPILTIFDGITHVNRGHRKKKVPKGQSRWDGQP